ncbi:MAG: hypothetical protein FJ405_12035 [Verrucomicrobia bacterium]|nr:hypothetical protein [Verrucomicrobiota bacterium]
MQQDISSQFGVSWPLVIAQLFLLLLVVAGVILAIRATIVSARTFRGALAPLWILLCWLLPVIGPIAALIAARRHIQSEGRHVA